MLFRSINEVQDNVHEDDYFDQGTKPFTDKYTKTKVPDRDVPQDKDPYTHYPAVRTYLTDDTVTAIPSTVYSERNIANQPMDGENHTIRDPAGWEEPSLDKSSRITRALSVVIEDLLKPSDRSEYVYPNESLIENAYVDGAGIELTWDNLWTYRSANARGVMSYMYTYLTDVTSFPF